jgi:hypothetical protein
MELSFLARYLLDPSRGEDAGPATAPVVFLKGLMMDASRWDGPVADLPKATLGPLILRRNG